MATPKPKPKKGKKPHSPGGKAPTKPKSLSPSPTSPSSMGGTTKVSSSPSTPGSSSSSSSSIPTLPEAIKDIMDRLQEIFSRLQSSSPPQQPQPPKEPEKEEEEIEKKEEKPLEEKLAEVPPGVKKEIAKEFIRYTPKIKEKIEYVPKEEFPVLFSAYRLNKGLPAVPNKIYIPIFANSYTTIFKQAVLDNIKPTKTIKKLKVKYKGKPEEKTLELLEKVGDEAIKRFILDGLNYLIREELENNLEKREPLKITEKIVPLKDYIEKIKEIEKDPNKLTKILAGTIASHEAEKIGEIIKAQGPDAALMYMLNTYYQPKNEDLLKTIQQRLA